MNVFRRIYDSEAYALLERLAAPRMDGFVAGQEVWQRVDAMLKEVAPSFHDRLSQAVLTDNEWRVSVCTTMLFTTKEIASILGVRSSQVSNLKASSNMKLFDNSGAAGLEKSLLHILE